MHWAMSVSFYINLNHLSNSYSRYSGRGSHRSEGEYEEERFVDRKEYDGKWADGNEPDRAERQERPERPQAEPKPPAPEPVPETKE